MKQALCTVKASEHGKVVTGKGYSHYGVHRTNRTVCIHNLALLLHYCSDSLPSGFSRESPLMPSTRSILLLGTWSPGTSSRWLRRTVWPPRSTMSKPPFCNPSPLRLPSMPSLRACRGGWGPLALLVRHRSAGLGGRSSFQRATQLTLDIVLRDMAEIRAAQMLTKLNRL